MVLLHSFNFSPGKSKPAVAGAFPTYRRKHLRGQISICIEPYENKCLEPIRVLAPLAAGHVFFTHSVRIARLLHVRLGGATAAVGSVGGYSGQIRQLAAPKKAQAIGASEHSDSAKAAAAP